MKPITVFEYERIAGLSDAQQNLLEKLNKSSGETLFRFDRRDAYATSFVGVVQLGADTLQVLPKMYREEAAAERDATANLLFLLSYTRKLDITEPEISRLTAQRALFSEILFWIFFPTALGSRPPRSPARLRDHRGPARRAQRPLARRHPSRSPRRLATRPLRCRLRRIHRGQPPQPALQSSPSNASPVGRNGPTPACVAEATSARRRPAGA